MHVVKARAACTVLTQRCAGLRWILRATSLGCPSRSKQFTVRFVTTSRPDIEILHACTTSRWLCNDDLQRNMRYAPFNADALEQIVCRSVSAQRCVSWEKIGEGSYNKVFRLLCDNGAEVAVRIPSPIVGNVERTTASEVATMSFIRDRWLSEKPGFMPIPPKVLAWDATYRNPVGTPFIVVEYVHGVTLQSRWAKIKGDVVAAAMDDIRALESPLLHLPFAMHGALYFADDVPHHASTCERPLFLGNGEGNVAPADEVSLQLSKKYVIGPTVDRGWWRGIYGHVDANRGPWPDMQSMIESAARLQLTALDTAADLSAPCLKSQPSDEPLLRVLLEACIRVAPFMVPTDPAVTQPVLNHPDLSLNNLITSPEGPAHIRHAIDWQGTTVAPFAMQCVLPHALVYTGGLIRLDDVLVPWPDNFDEMTPAEQTVIEYHHRLASRHKKYVYETLIVDEFRYDVWRLPHYEALANLVMYITRCIADGPGDLHGCLIDLQRNWDKVSDAPCPLNFNQEEIASAMAQREDRREYRCHVENLYTELRCRDDGSVEPERYEIAKALMERRRAVWDEAAMKGPFPFYEGAHSYHLT
ncbi:kinase-like domain-containing protein [Trametes meyenii]|nr:kinase-like domain-containing protein [Trametes meyenii]